MAEEFVRIGQFEQFCRGNEQRFLDLEKKMDQGFAHAAKEREHILVHLSQRFDDMKESVNHRFDGVNQRFDSLERQLNWHNRILMGLLLVILAGVVKYLFFQS